MTTAPELSEARIAQAETIDALSQYQFGWSDSHDVGADAKRGLTEDVVREISALKNEPDWMLQRRLKVRGNPRDLLRFRKLFA